MYVAQLVLCNKLDRHTVAKQSISTQMTLFSDLRIRGEMEVNVAQRVLCNTLERYTVAKQSISIQIIHNVRFICNYKYVVLPFCYYVSFCMV